MSLPDLALARPGLSVLHPPPPTPLPRHAIRAMGMPARAIAEFKGSWMLGGNWFLLASPAGLEPATHSLGIHD
jgi:hypothetical protein